MLYNLIKILTKEVLLMPKFKDLMGQKFGRLTIIELAGRNKSHKIIWKCLCDCGKEAIVVGTCLVTGRTKSCGCLHKEVITKHGLTGSRIYAIWNSMMSRCYHPKNKYFKGYGARGIRVCNEWHDAKTFYNWAQNNGYKKGLTIDRINNNGNYEPSNCRWATLKEQCNNKRTNRLITINGITHNLTEWATIAGLKKATLHARLRARWKEENLLLPPKTRHHKAN